MPSPAPAPDTPAGGLSEQEAVSRRAQGLGNDARIQTGRSYRRILRDNVFTFFNTVLFGLGLLLLLLGSPKDALFTVFAAFLNVIVGTLQEVRAKRKLDEIALLTRPQATVRREGQEREIDPSEIVAGDILIVGQGDQMMVDGVVVGPGAVDVDESLLTGESLAVGKHVGDPLYSGSFVVSGRTAYVAQAVGANSYANRLTASARVFTRQLTPLQREVNLLIRVLLLLVAFFGMVIALELVIYEDVTLLSAVQSAAVTFGLAPSGLFLIIVVAYALGALRIAGKGGLAQQVNAVESLSNITVLCLDKTGTLTANRLRLESVQPLPGHTLSEPDLRDLLGAYARSVTAGTATTDAIARGCPGRARQVVEEVPFSSARRWSALSFAADGPVEPGSGQEGLFVLGAPEALAPYVGPEAILPSVAAWTSAGLRVLLFAHAPRPSPASEVTGLPALTPLCYVILSDELRPEARETLEGFRRAGIEVKIISGDDPDTVAALARQVGLDGGGQPLNVVSGADLAAMDDLHFAQAASTAAVFGRIGPDQKERLVRALASQGHYVAMTGDGVNDVLALKQAHVGIAMQSGSQAARGVADLVLLDDSFAALPHAFAEGQRILNGIDDILKIYLSHIFSLALLIATIAMLSAGFPFTPGLISIVSIFTITIPTLGLALWAQPGAVLRQSLVRRLAHFLPPAAVTIALAGLAIYLYFIATAGDMASAQTALTYGKVLMGLVLVLFVAPPTRFWSGGAPVRRDWRPALLALGVLVLLLVFSAIPPLRRFFELTPLPSRVDGPIIFGVIVIWLFVLRFVWRARLFERYLGIDLGAPPH